MSGEAEQVEAEIQTVVSQRLRGITNSIAGLAASKHNRHLQQLLEYERKRNAELEQQLAEAKKQLEEIEQ